MWSGGSLEKMEKTWRSEDHFIFIYRSILFFFTEDALILNEKAVLGVDMRMWVYTVDNLIKDCTDCAIVNVRRAVKY